MTQCTTRGIISKCTIMLFIYEFWTSWKRAPQLSVSHKMSLRQFVPQQTQLRLCRRKIKDSESKTGFTLNPRCLRMICFGSEYHLGNLHALPWASIYLFQNEMTGLFISYILSTCNFWWCFSLKSLSPQSFNLKKYKMCL